MLDGKDRISGAVNDEKRRLLRVEPALPFIAAFSMKWFTVRRREDLSWAGADRLVVTPALTWSEIETSLRLLPFHFNPQRFEDSR
jgi:hypothetical protein